MSRKIAFFISPHGFGHAARSAAIMSALSEISPSFSFEIFTTVPEWFFEDSHCMPFVYHLLETDIGLAQKNPLQEDLPRTIEQLNQFLPFKEDLISDLATVVQREKCDLIVCDIAPMGIAVSKKSGIPSVLIENFTWDWIYSRYDAYCEELKEHTSYLRNLFSLADYHIQAEPFCSPTEADLVIKPVSRRPRLVAEEIRKRLGIPDGKKLVVITMGGIPEQYHAYEKLSDNKDTFFIVPGGNKSLKTVNNIILLPHRSDFFHPDLINAGDAVIGKIGYSTLAEVYHACTPFGYVSRTSFPESEKLVDYVDQHMKGLCLSGSAYHNGSWVEILSDLLRLPKISRSTPNGADQAASFLKDVLS
ncbi:hypothetical protein KKA14_21420 [bacterium]|nr:hypothetical protein [bacterium]